MNACSDSIIWLVALVALVFGWYLGQRKPPEDKP